MLASERLRREAPSFQERLDYVREPLLDVAESTRTRVLGFGAAPAPQRGSGAVGPIPVVPALLVEWPIPAVGFAEFDNGGLVTVKPSYVGLHDLPVPAERAMEDWVIDTELTRGFGSHRLQFAGQVVVFALPRPLAQAAPGEPAHCSGPAGPGTFGSRVRVGGVDSFLTAGHVAPVGVGTPVYDRRARRIGTINQRMCCDFDGSGCAVLPNSDVPDVAIIGLSVPDTGASGTSQGVAQIRDMVTSHGAVTTGKQAELSTIATAFAGPGAANWGEAMLTAYPISAPGDSGAQVTNRAGEVIGQVVGGYPGIYSVVQDVDYLLKATGAVLR